MTSLTRHPDSVDRMYAVPASPAARAATSSPRGKNMRLLPTGASRKGRASVVPSTVVCRSHDRRGNGRPGPEDHVVEPAAVLAQRALGLGTAVDVVEGHPRQALLCGQAEVGDVEGASDAGVAHAAILPPMYPGRAGARPLRYAEHMDSLLAPMSGTERRDVGGAQIDVVHAGAARVRRIIYPVGFRWSVNVKPLVDSDACMHAHVGFLAKGRIEGRTPTGARSTSRRQRWWSSSRDTTPG